MTTVVAVGLGVVVDVGREVTVNVGVGAGVCVGGIWVAVAIGSGRLVGDGATLGLSMLTTIVGAVLAVTLSGDGRDSGH